MQNNIIQTFLHNRALTDADVAYLRQPRRDHQHDPRQLRDVDRWIDILHAVKQRSAAQAFPIAIIPDYDADGVLSGTLARVGLSLLGFGDAYLYAPKTKDGYGLTRRSVDNVTAAQPDTRVIITTDNGSNAHDGIKYAKSLGLVVLVTDHHLAEADPVADAVVNPNRHLGGTTESYPYTDISGTAVIYKTLQAYALKYQPDVLPTFETLILLVGMSTISDVMPLRDENRYYVTEAVDMLKRFVDGHSYERMMSYDDTPLGQYFRGVDLLVMTLNQQGKLKYGINADTFGFTTGPILNSPRRMMGESEIAFDLFRTTRDMLYEPEFNSPSDTLYALNEARKAHVKGLTASLFSYIDQTGPVGASHTVFNARMGGGIAGLLSGSFTQQYNLPSIAFSHPGIEGVNQDINLATDGLGSDVTLSGSARSPEYFDLHQFLGMLDKAHPGLIVSWGGHAQAAGIKIRAVDFDRFRSVFARGLMAIAEQAETTHGLSLGETATNVLPIAGEYLLTSDIYVEISSRGVLETPESVTVIEVPHNSPLHRKDVPTALSEAIAFFDSLAPYGQGFKAPTFSVMFKMTDVKAFYMGQDKQHAKLTMNNGLSIIKWNDAPLFRDSVPEGLPDHRIFVATGELSVNEFNGRVNLQLMANSIELVG